MYFALPLPLSTIVMNIWRCEQWAQQKLCLDLFYESIWFCLMSTSRCDFSRNIVLHLWLPPHTQTPFVTHFYFNNLMNCDEKQILSRRCHAVSWSIYRFFCFTKLYRSLVDGCRKLNKTCSTTADSRQAESKFRITQFWWGDDEDCRSIHRTKFGFVAFSHHILWNRRHSKRATEHVKLYARIFARVVPYICGEEFRLHK